MGLRGRSSADRAVHNTQQWSHCRREGGSAIEQVVACLLVAFVLDPPLVCKLGALATWTHKARPLCPQPSRPLHLPSNRWDAISIPFEGDVLERACLAKQLTGYLAR